MIDYRIAATAVALVAGGCASGASDPAPADGGRYAAGAFRAEAALRTSAGADAGTATVAQDDGGLKIMIDARGLPPGPHGAHIHMVGKCDAPDFTTAGGHWNPTSHQHGTMNPAGPHAGDIPNLDVAADGTGRLEARLPAGTYEGLLDQDGAAMMIHAGPDDLKTDPSGNSGGRIACGVFQAL